MLYAAIATGWLVSSFGASLIIGPVLKNGPRAAARSHPKTLLSTTTLGIPRVVLSGVHGSSFPASLIAGGEPHNLYLSLN
jgi:hypothetical protein